MSFVVARMQKMKAGNLVGIGNHNQRLIDNHSNKDIDTERSYLNYDLVNRTDNYKTDIQQFINENKLSSRAVRKDAVLINEWIITSDNQFFKDKDDKEIKDFFDTAKSYFADKFGDNNIRYAQVHLDETTPHMHLGIVPFNDEHKLSAKTVFNRQALQAVQDELPKYLNERGFELERGEKGSERKNLTVHGAESTLHPTQLVMATGMSGSPNKPTLPGQDKFQGEIRHSSEHPGGDVDRDKNVVVLGANNSAHDICADLYSNGAKPVMIQRSSTHIVRSDSLMREVFGPLYSEDAVEAGIDTDTADLLFASWPYKVLPGVQKQAFDKIREDDKEFYDKLENAGFLLDFGDDDSGLFLKYLRRGSGYYIDVGASELVADGKIPVRSNVSIEDVKENSVVLTDGTELPADVIVLATGYGNMNNWVAQLVDQETADKVGPCWGLGSETTKDPGPWEGELRNMWKPTNVDSLWFHGGNLHQSRHYSRYLSMQLKARYEGMNTPVYSK